MTTEARRTLGCPVVLLYLVAAPVYLVRALILVVRLWRLRRISRAGYVACPHCHAENAIDVLATCPRCKAREFGNRLRCTGCGAEGTSFPCDACGVTIHCF